MGVFILIGFIGALAAVCLAAFSLPRVRRARYDLFYLVHVPAAAFFVLMGAIHDFDMQVFCVPGLVAYFLDRTDFLNRTATSRFHQMTGRVRVMNSDWIRLDLVDDSGVMASEGAYGTQWLYLRVPALGGEAHAFSLAARGPSVVIKGSGDWTKRLHQLAVEQATDALSAVSTTAVGVADEAGSSQEKPLRHALRFDEGSEPPDLKQLSGITTELRCEIDGVYGNVSPPWRSFSNVLFVGGGVGVTPWLPAMEEYHETYRTHGTTAQTMRLVWIGRDHAELNAMRPYLPKANTAVFLTRTNVDTTEAPAVFDAPEDWEVLPCGGARQAAVGKKEATPRLFAFVGVASLCLTQISYYSIRGAHSVYAEYTNEGHPTEAQYLVSRVLPVACSFVAIAVATVFARWASSCIPSNALCPCGAADADRDRAHDTKSTCMQQKPKGSSQHQQLHELVPSLSVNCGRPDMAATIDAAVAEVNARLPAAPGSITDGLYVCVCGPESLVKSCKDAAKDAQNRCKGVAIRLHAEDPGW